MAHQSAPLASLSLSPGVTAPGQPLLDAPGCPVRPHHQLAGRHLPSFACDGPPWLGGPLGGSTARATGAAAEAWVASFTDSPQPTAWGGGSRSRRRGLDQSVAHRQEDEAWQGLGEAVGELVRGGDMARHGDLARHHVAQELSVA